MKKRPIAVELFGYWFDIEYVATMIGEPDVEGIIYNKERLIRVVDNKEWELSLKHEIAHGLLSITGFSELFSEEMEEGLMILLENGMGDLFSINKNSPKWKF